MSKGEITMTMTRSIIEAMAAFTAIADAVADIDISNQSKLAAVIAAMTNAAIENGATADTVGKDVMAAIKRSVNAGSPEFHRWLRTEAERQFAGVL
jgi:hypothetical protein